MVLLLDPYVDAVLLLALAFLIVGIMRSITPFLAKIPWVGGSIANAAEGIAAAISRACGVAFRGIDHAIGVSFHAIAGFLGRSWHEFRSHAHAILQIATVLGLVVSAMHHLRSLIHSIEGPLHTVLHRFVQIGRELRGIGHRVKTLEREIGRGIGHDIRIRIKALEKEYTGLRDRVIPDLRSAVNVAEGDLSDLRRWLGVKTGISYKEWAIGLATALLAAVGLGGLQCNSNPFKNNPNACGLWGDLAGLLAAAGIFGAVLDFRDIVKASVVVIDEGTQAIQALTVLDDAAIQDAAQAVAAAMRAVSS